MLTRAAARCQSGVGVVHFGKNCRPPSTENLDPWGWGPPARSCEGCVGLGGGGAGIGGVSAGEQGGGGDEIKCHSLLRGVLYALLR
jgi:hypothetical protein